MGGRVSSRVKKGTEHPLDIYFFAVYDIGVSAENPGYGMAKNKRAMAFTTKELRNAFIKSRPFDFHVGPIASGRALRMILPIPGTYDTGLPLDNSSSYLKLKGVFY